MNKNRKLDIIGAQMDLGASQKGVGMGPFAVRFAGLVAGLEEMGYEVRDKGDVIPPLDGMSRRGLMHYDQVVETNRQIYEYVKESLNDGRFPIVLGGDHCVAAGSISAVAKHYAPQGEIGIIWIDAACRSRRSADTARTGWSTSARIRTLYRPHTVCRLRDMRSTSLRRRA